MLQLKKYTPIFILFLIVVTLLFVASDPLWDICIDRDFFRGSLIFEKFLIWGPELYRGGYLPGPFLYLFIFILKFFSFGSIGGMNVLLQCLSILITIYFCTKLIKINTFKISYLFLIVLFSHPLMMEFAYNFWNPSFSIPFHLLSFFGVYHVTYRESGAGPIRIALFLLFVYLGSQCHFSTVVWIPLFIVALVGNKDWRGLGFFFIMMALSIIFLNILYKGQFIKNFTFAEKSILNSQNHQGYLGTIGGNDFLIKFKRIFWVLYNFIGGNFPLTTFGISKDRMRWVDSVPIKSWWEWSLVIIPSFLSMFLFIKGFWKEKKLRAVLITAGLFSVVIILQDSVDGSEFAQYRRHLYLLPLFAFVIYSGLQTVMNKLFFTLVLPLFWLLNFFQFNYSAEPSQRISHLKKTMNRIVSESSMSEKEVLFFASSIRERTWSDLQQVMVPKLTYKMMGFFLGNQNRVNLSLPSKPPSKCLAVKSLFDKELFNGFRKKVEVIEEYEWGFSYLPLKYNCYGVMGGFLNHFLYTNIGVEDESFNFPDGHQLQLSIVVDSSGEQFVRIFSMNKNPFIWTGRNKNFGFYSSQYRIMLLRSSGETNLLEQPFDGKEEFAPAYLFLKSKDLKPGDKLKIEFEGKAIEFNLLEGLKLQKI